jgi:ferredoxin
MNRARQLVYLRNVVTLNLDNSRCSGCGTCMEVCPHAVLAQENGKVRIEDRDACMECGACARNCPTAAISVQAGVGCAAAVINSALGRGSSSACCSLEPSAPACGCSAESQPQRKSSCC